MTGKWIKKDNANNYFMINPGKIVYAKDGQLLEQWGVNKYIYIKKYGEVMSNVSFFLNILDIFRQHIKF